MTDRPALEPTNSSITIRDATWEDLPAIVALLVDDVLGAKRESAGKDAAAPYQKAFAEIDKDPCNHVLVAIDGREIIGCLQLTLIAHLNFQGGRRAQIEGVRVKASHRRRGIGRQMIEHAVDVARQHECRIAQLTTNKVRQDAIRFYEQIGFDPTHVGFKRYL